MMNKTELMAKEWLEKKGYHENDMIFRPQVSPDFICKDGKRYEVKFLYGNKLLFYNKQVKQLKNTDIILVFTNKGFFSEFMWGERNKTIFDITIKANNEHLKAIRISDETKKWLTDLKFKNRCSGIDDVIRKIKNKEIKIP